MNSLPKKKLPVTLLRIIEFLRANGAKDIVAICEALQLSHNSVSCVLSNAYGKSLTRTGPRRCYVYDVKKDDESKPEVTDVPVVTSRAGPVYHREYAGWGGFPRMTGIVNWGGRR